jgi:hypothetical protein
MWVILRIMTGGVRFLYEGKCVGVIGTGATGVQEKWTAEIYADFEMTLLAASDDAR